MLIKKEKKGNITVYNVDKDYDDDKMEKVMDKKLKPNDIKLIIKDDADVYDKDGKMLLRFRKDKLKKANVDAFYDNVIDFAQNETSNRGSATASKKKNINDNSKIMTNILGYFDKFSARQKMIFKKRGFTPFLISNAHFL